MSAPRRKAGATPVRHMFGAIAPEPLPLWLELWNALVPHLEAHAVCAEQTDNAGDKIPLRCIDVDDEIRVRVKVNGHFAHHTKPRFFFPGVTPELRCALAETLYPNGIAWMLPVVAAEQNRRARTARPEDFWSWWLSELPASELARQLERAQRMMDVGALSYHPGARGWRPSTTVAPPDGTAAAGRAHEAWRRTAGKQRGSVQAQLWWSGQRTGWRWRVGRGSSTATASRYGFHPTYRVLSDGQAKSRADAVEAADAAIVEWAGVEDENGVKDAAKRAAVRMAERAEDVPDAAADVPDGDGNYDCTQCGNTTPRNGWCDRCIAEEEARTS